MKLKNTTSTPHIPDYTIRRMASFCCRQLGMKTSRVTSLTIRNRADGFTSGRCWLRTGRIVCSVGYILTDAKPDTPAGRRDPIAHDLQRLDTDHALRLRVEKLLGVLAHEVAHRSTYLEGSAKGPRSKRPGECEKTVQWHANRVMEAYRERKDELLAYWLKAPAKPERAERVAADPRRVRAQKDLELLKRWETKKRLASTKVSKYKRKVARARRDGLID